ncbi:hypothetical protein [Halioxenophilus sp. WMMB6]|uniref:hypothetical protein n=1 Tax=Halioxenophilus sp. WMMB6 TaxID=3073815 RepID=UPI00295F415C|nr:hypothetical protein [Halioxenophilus sp. WMMB6]
MDKITFWRRPALASALSLLAVATGGSPLAPSSTTPEATKVACHQFPQPVYFQQRPLACGTSDCQPRLVEHACQARVPGDCDKSNSWRSVYAITGLPAGSQIVKTIRKAQSADGDQLLVCWYYQ